MSEVLRPWLLKHFHQLAERDGPNDAFEQVRKKVQITKFHTDGGQPVKSGELWAEASDRERFVNVLICPSSVEKHKATHNGERITQVRLGNFFITKCRPIIAQTPVFRNNIWSLNAPGLCLEAEVEFIGGRGCSSVHGDPVVITRDPRVKAWENKLLTRGFIPTAPKQEEPVSTTNAAPSGRVSADEATAERQTTSPRSTTAVGEPGPWQAHLMKWFGTTEIKWPSREAQREQKQAFDKAARRTDDIPVQDPPPDTNANSQNEPADPTQDAIPWPPTPPRGAPEQESDSDDESRSSAGVQATQEMDGMDQDELGDEDAEGSTDDGEEDEEDEEEEDAEEGLAWEKDQEDVDMSGAQTPASLDAVEDALGTQISEEDEDSPVQSATSFPPSSSAPATPLHVAVEDSPPTSRSPGAAQPYTAPQTHASSPISAGKHPRASSSAPEQSQKGSVGVRAGTVPPRPSPASGQHDPEIWTQPSFMRRTQPGSAAPTQQTTAGSHTAQAGPSQAPASTRATDADYRDEHDRQGFLAAGLGTEEDWEREPEEEQATVPDRAPKQALRSEFRSDPNARQDLQERIQAASEQLRNGKRRSTEEQDSEAGPSKKRRLVNDSQPSNGQRQDTSQRSHSSSNGKVGRQAARKTAIPSVQHDVFDAPTVTGDQIPIVRAALSSAPARKKGKRASPFDSESDDNGTNEAAKKRALKEAERAEARFRFAKPEQSVRHVSPAHKRVSRVEIAHEVSVGLSRKLDDIQKEDQIASEQARLKAAAERIAEVSRRAAQPSTSIPEQVMQRTVAEPSAEATRKAGLSSSSKPPPARPSTPPSPSISVGRGIKTSPVHVQHVRLMGRSPRRKSTLESNRDAALVEPTAASPTVPSLPNEAVEPPAVETMEEPSAMPPAAAETEVISAPAMLPPPTVEALPPPAIAATAETSTVASARAPPPLLGGFRPTLTLDPKDSALCLSIADLGQILQEIDEYRAHGF
ncbi:hypothetical protein CALVIDRAFT_596546 [Calocera viscosa TUFC12733]|uniref:Telomere replication protein EST3 n=1 Tax=Calocera viscosa (strain TUFC12733) TaxID=1330018 RepID=A0A167PMH9_CALVF|nr:hypothetical protein CALVIDRAFT_596546 [Calocera viscosa TUFC12733]